MSPRPRSKSRTVDAELIDLRTLVPLDLETITASVEKTGHCVIVHEAPRTGGFGAEIVALLQQALLLPSGSADRTRHGLGYPVSRMPRSGNTCPAASGSRARSHRSLAA